MGAQDGRSRATVADRLLDEAYRFDFFQAVRLLERMSLESAGGDPNEATQPVGYDTDPGNEVVRFRSLVSLHFPASAVSAVSRSSRRDRAPSGDPRGSDGNHRFPFEMVVNFMGLAGPSGVLPQHYTQLLIDLNRNKDLSLQDFLDIFNHRLISLFFRAWEKYRFPVAYERYRLRGSRSRHDLFTGCLFSLVGCGTRGLLERMAVDDEILLYYSGLFANRHRSTLALKGLLESYFGAPAEILQFQGQWLELPAVNRPVMSSRNPSPQSSALGQTTILGTRVWDVQGKFRVRLGPLSYPQFCRFIPSGDGIRPLYHLVRTFVGPDLEFDVQPVLKAEEVPPLKLTSDGGQALLGWTAWTRASPMETDFDGACFQLSDE
jgi:type VI secretion system protein ImpH